MPCRRCDICGLIGVAGTPGHKERSAVSTLLYLDVIRGPHSTGIAAIDIDYKKNEERLFTFKSVGEPGRVYEKYPKDFDKGVYKYGTDVLIGHNRYATQGEVNDDNAHPFVFENIVGAHNGTVVQWSLKDFHRAKDYKIDSQIIFSQIDHDNNLQTVWDKADGALALVWWDSRDKRLHIARNDQRSLYYCYTQDEKNIFWASESWMLSVALGRHDIKHKEIHPIIKDKHYTFSVEFDKVMEWSTPLIPFVSQASAWDDWNTYYKGSGVKTTNVVKPVWDWVKVKITEFNKTGTEEHVGYFAGTTEDGRDVVINTNGVKQKEHYDTIMELATKGTSEFRFKSNHAWVQNKLLTIHSTGLEEIPALSAVVEEKKATTTGWKGKQLTRKDFEDLCNCGCSFCGGEITWADSEEVLWAGAVYPICTECKDIGIVKDWLKEAEMEEEKV